MLAGSHASVITIEKAAPHSGLPRQLPATANRITVTVH
jgi:hypothetical protein